jgi:hypothetical protein
MELDHITFIQASVMTKALASEANRMGMPKWIILHLVAYIYPQPLKLCNDETRYI